MARNLVNVESVNKAFDVKQLLVAVSLGVAEGERIGIVGRNGAGKSTLMKLIAGIEQPDSGRVTKSNSVKLGASMIIFSNELFSLYQVVNAVALD